MKESPFTKKLAQPTRQPRRWSRQLPCVQQSMRPAACGGASKAARRLCVNHRGWRPRALPRPRRLLSCASERSRPATPKYEYNPLAKGGDVALTDAAVVAAAAASLASATAAAASIRRALRASSSSAICALASRWRSQVSENDHGRRTVSRIYVKLVTDAPLNVSFAAPTSFMSSSIRTASRSAAVLRFCKSET